YNVNDQLTQSNKGQGDAQDRAEILRFVYNNDGQILYRFHDTGEGNQITHTEYAYANGHPVGQTGNTEDDITGSQTLLDTGRYNLMQPYGEDYPDSAVTFYTVQAGDTLQAIAGAVYGNPSLWYLIAEANGLAPDAALSEGQRLQIPNSVQSGRLTADTHVVYEEGDIIGSTLPNLKSDPQDSGGCGGFLSILIVVVIAFVAFLVVGPLASTISQSLFGTALTSTLSVSSLASYAIAGAIVGAAASIVQQGLFIALGYQDEFSWKSVAAGAISGALAGAARGVGQAAAALTKAGETASHVTLAARALQVASVATKQLIENGKITSWASLAVAALGPVRGVGENGEVVHLVEAVGAGSDGLLGAAVDYLSPWLNAAESYLRTGEVTPTDWANGVAGTLSNAINGNGLGETESFGNLRISSRQLITNLAVGGVLTAFDRRAGLDYLANTVG
ncbi:LysM peptidoglycan-binding domain-containing protein, partial [Sedimenticola hydrogenitrophicus]|uniref:LysM peptidoglycan-binding domain-containing protein n=1 Tax=Sedimenticola hydrogenitrophicus TaxID=2967975 RepID=UPI0021A5297B